MGIDMKVATTQYKFVEKEASVFYRFLLNIYGVTITISEVELGKWQLYIGCTIVLKYSGHAMWFGLVLGEHLW